MQTFLGLSRVPPLERVTSLRTSAWEASFGGDLWQIFLAILKNKTIAQLVVFVVVLASLSIGKRISLKKKLPRGLYFACRVLHCLPCPLFFLP